MYVHIYAHDVYSVHSTVDVCIILYTSHVNILCMYVLHVILCLFVCKPVLYRMYRMYAIVHGVCGGGGGVCTDLTCTSLCYLR